MNICCFVNDFKIIYIYFKNLVGRTLATQRRSREEATIALRKKKREEFFTAKRAEFTGTLPVGPLVSF